jgi:hypothetical protein
MTLDHIFATIKIDTTVEFYTTVAFGFPTDVIARDEA